MKTARALAVLGIGVLAFLGAQAAGELQAAPTGHGTSVTANTSWGWPVCIPGDKHDACQRTSPWPGSTVPTHGA
ncbi:hypothetical protein P3T37_004580 [Kitasatospora sp. MAA4]|uniref:hypothetical protein n=1 Tax=Kitasatospora sp. MAA4 TaxID=3035093 RepID=UPI00247409B9|nr:hypothetical protein [Kitasatospora sp. MAA4]MDH6135170.1 hypothetical protein [Kitasatospora sp. MAA4]